MNQDQLVEKFANLSTPLIADACVRLKVDLRIAPPGVRSLLPQQHVVGRALPVRHYGSVDIFLEAMLSAQPGDILVIDNQGRLDEGCIGDLTVLEAQAHAIRALFVWGAHRDTTELLQIGLPVFSYAAFPAGPVRLDVRDAQALESAQIGDFLVTRSDLFIGDKDGVMFISLTKADKILAVAQSIYDTEREQALDIRSGITLTTQLRFEEYLDQRAKDPTYTFRKHLRKLGGAIEE